MRTHSSAASLIVVGLLGLGLFGPRVARADSSCVKDSDCVKGWVCQVTGASGCGYACAPGASCPPPPDCATVETKSCVPGPCSADSDCAAGMVCYKSQSGCDVPACAPGANCPTTTCTPTTQSACIPRYDAPCTADADCGAGFTCTLDSLGCACAGAATPPSDGGVDPLPPPPCECPAATTSSCHAVSKACASAADCASGWTCDLVASPSGCASASSEPATPAKGIDGGAAPQPAQDAGVDPCPPAPPPTRMCVPPYYSLGGPTRGTGADQGQVTGLPAGGTTTASGGTTPTAPSNAANPSNTSTAAGCSVSHGSNGGAGALSLLALALVGFVRRPRKRSAAR